MQGTHFVRVSYCCESNKNRESILHCGYFIDLASVNWHQQGAMTCNETLSTNRRGGGCGGPPQKQPKGFSKWGD